MPFIVDESEFITLDENGYLLSEEQIVDDNEYSGYADFYNNNQQYFTNPTILLFHGGDCPVVFPSAYYNDPNKTRDFGDGFYTTDDVEQAQRWALRKLEETGWGVVSVYEYTGDLSGKIFDEDPSMEWLEFIIQCRKSKCRHNEYDIIEGPVADDDVGKTIDKCIKNIMTKEDALAQLSYRDRSHQLVFTDDPQLSHIRFLGWWSV